MRTDELGVWVTLKASPFHVCTMSNLVVMRQMVYA